MESVVVHGRSYAAATYGVYWVKSLTPAGETYTLPTELQPPFGEDPTKLAVGIRIALPKAQVFAVTDAAGINNADGSGGGNTVSRGSGDQKRESYISFICGTGEEAKVSVHT